MTQKIIIVGFLQMYCLSNISKRN